MATQISFPRDPSPAADLRSRKKERLRLAVQDAAVALFAEQGFESTTIEQIVARAETSVSTFFRYFRSKADVLVDDDGGAHLRFLQQKIVERPSHETGVVATCKGLLEAWVRPVDDPERSIAMAAVVESSTLLLGLRYEVIRNWIDAVAHALARRDGKTPPSRRHRMIAQIVVGVFCDSVQEWIDGKCTKDLRRVVIRDFRAMAMLREEMNGVAQGSIIDV